MKGRVLLVTYTMLAPIVGGAFFRALRLAMELHGRGWHPTICNSGPMLEDPKIDAAAGKVEFIPLSAKQSESSIEAFRFLKALRPNVVVQGEGPMPTMERIYEGARRVACPFVVLDQFYNHFLKPRRRGVDLALLYGLKSIWKDDGRLSHPFQMVPPFIEDVTPPERLPVPASLRTRPLLLLVAYERPILEKGVHVLSGLTQAPLGAILVSPDPAEGGRLMEGAGFSCGRFVSLPLSGDPDVFGLMALCSVSLVSNGFLQVMESIALESPVIALPRGTGVGMGPLNFDSRFDPYLSYDEEPERQRERILEWLRHPPFDEEMRRSLREERHGAGLCADRIESLAAQWNSRPALLMRARKAGAYFAGTLFRE